MTTPWQEIMYRQSAVSQEALLDFLTNACSYPHRPQRACLVQTHASYIIIAPPFVYKVKKPVNFGFLDFSTLEKRRYFCEREIKLNRRLCPDVYLDVIPISLKEGRLAFGAGDEVVEYAVKMRELSDRDFLHRRMERGEVGPEDLNRVAATLKAFYDAQTPTEEIEEWGQVERLKISTDENFRQTEACVGRTISRPAFEAIRFYTDEFYVHNAALFASRIQEKWIRDCHGDLHLEHIHLSPTAIHIYDCIEFNDRLRYVDVANDVAFLAMDLDFNHRPDLSRHFVAQMTKMLNDSQMPRLMDFYKCYRAYVRGKVESIHSSEPEEIEFVREKSRERARRYFRLALQYAVVGSEPMALVVMGRIGSGKSTLASGLADELGWEVFSSDRTRKELAGVPLHERSDADARASLYSKQMTEKTYETLFQNAVHCVKQGRSLILDATFSRRLYRDRLRERFERLGIPYDFVEAQASDEVVKERLAGRDRKPDEVSDARLEDFEALSRSYEPPTELSAHQLLAVGTGSPTESTVINVLKGLVSLRMARSVRDSCRTECRT
jgi:hypothetical protein